MIKKKNEKQVKSLIHPSKEVILKKISNYQNKMADCMEKSLKSPNAKKIIK